MKASETIRKKIQFHEGEIRKHKDILRELSPIGIKYEISRQIPFSVQLNYIFPCQCGRKTVSFIIYHGQMRCCRCATRKWGPMRSIKNWSITND